MRSIDASLDRTPGKCYAVFTDGDGNQEAESVPRRSSILAFPRHPAKATASRWLRLRSSEGATSGSRNHLCVAVRSLTENLEHRHPRVGEFDPRCWRYASGEGFLLCNTNLNLKVRHPASGFFVMARRRSAGLLAHSSRANVPSHRRDQPADDPKDRRGAAGPGQRS